MAASRNFSGAIAPSRPPSAPESISARVPASRPLPETSTTASSSRRPPSERADTRKSPPKAPPPAGAQIDVGVPARRQRRQLTLAAQLVAQLQQDRLAAAGGQPESLPVPRELHRDQRDQHQQDQRAWPHGVPALVRDLHDEGDRRRRAAACAAPAGRAGSRRARQAAPAPRAARTDTPPSSVSTAIATVSATRIDERDELGAGRVPGREHGHAPAGLAQARDRPPGRTAGLPAVGDHDRWQITGLRLLRNRRDLPASGVARSRPRSTLPRMSPPHRRDRPGNGEEAAHVAALSGGGPSQLGIDGSMRARDVSRPKAGRPGRSRAAGAGVLPPAVAPPAGQRRSDAGSGGSSPVSS